MGGHGSGRSGGRPTTDNGLTLTLSKLFRDKLFRPGSACYNPMHSWPMHQALRCHAKSKRSGLQCRAPAVRGHSICRMHGAGGGAPRGNNNALKHGFFTAEAVETRRMVAALTKQARELVETV